MCVSVNGGLCTGPWLPYTWPWLQPPLYRTPALAPPVQGPSSLLDMFKLVQLAQLRPRLYKKPSDMLKIDHSVTHTVGKLVPSCLPFICYFCNSKYFSGYTCTFFVILLSFLFPTLFFFPVFPFVSVNAPKQEISFKLVKTIFLNNSVDRYRSIGAFVLSGYFDVGSIRLTRLSSLHLELRTFHPVRNTEPQFVFPDKVAM